ncbi:Crp/Fnr family transcriptional regulator [Flavobacterium sp. LAR06]|uniref:Crp/Fnr family transcriptional regulator n=1 Tax=Flavobacterium sp. LAR06 TaxID=3064897 RepID=UPI0035C1A0A3
MVYSIEVKKGTVLLKESQICNRAFFVCKGILRCYTVDEMGKDHIIQFASENWWIADRSSFYFDEPSELYSDVIEDAELVYTHKDFIKNALQVSQKFSSYNSLALQRNIRQMQKRINYLLSASAEKKYLDFIETYPKITQRVPLQMIVSYLRITPESLRRIRKELARKSFKS